MLQIDKIGNWSRQLGLLPIKLFGTGGPSEQFVMLNGSSGNFCLDLNKDNCVERAKDFAWSSDVGYFVDFVSNDVLLSRWDKIGEQGVEKIAIKDIAENIDKFYEYLIKSQPKKDNSIVNYSIKTFRKIRHCLRNQSQDNGYDSLQAFLVLLASVTEGEVTPDNIDIAKWGITKSHIQIANSIRSQDWEMLQHELRKGIAYFGIKPDFSLALRHSSGKLFQEAHYESSFINPSQLTIDGILLESPKPTTKTESIGVHYTPAAIVRTLVEESLYELNITDKQKITVFDPACGSGEFLRETLRQLKSKNYIGQVELIGWDLSSSAINMSKFIIAFESKDWEQGAITSCFEVKDSLQEKNWPQNIDILLMNPPYVSWQEMSRSQKDTVSEILSTLKEKTPDYSSAFIWKASQSLAQGGILSTIVPASFFSGESNKKLRGELVTSLSTLLLGKLGSQVLFTDALVDSVIYIAKKGNGASTIALWADVHVNSASMALRELRKRRLLNDTNLVIDKNNFSIYPTENLGKNERNWTPRSYKTHEITEKLKSTSKVKDVFEIQQGARTGYNQAFLIDKEFFYSLPKKEQPFFRPCAINRSFYKGRLKDDFYVFYPFGKDLSPIVEEADLIKHVKKYFNLKLHPNKSILSTRARKTILNWWKLSEHRAWQVKKIPKLVSTYFGKAGSFALDGTGEFVVVQGFGWTPKNKMSLKVTYAYLAILHAPFLNQLLSSVANQVSGGQFDLSKKYLDDMPIPYLVDESSDILIKLSEIGMAIHKGNEIDHDVLDEIVLSAYNLV